MKHIKIFDSQAAFDAADIEAPYIVSVAGSVVYSGTTDTDAPASTYEMVDLGLPSGLKWAKCNVGADKESDYGLYFAFGEVVGHDADNCNRYDGSTPDVEVDGSNHLLPAYDAATKLMGAGYRMPTREEMVELSQNTEHSVATIDGVSGMKFSKKGDDSTYIFIPFAGRCEYGEIISITENGYLWSSTLVDGSNAGAFNYSNFEIVRTLSYYRYAGFSVRAVCK